VALIAGTPERRFSPTHVLCVFGGGTGLGHEGELADRGPRLPKSSLPKLTNLISISRRYRERPTLRIRSCLIDGNDDRTLAAMIASGSGERVKRPRRCSHRTGKSPSNWCRTPNRPANRRANRGCRQSRRRPRSVTRKSRHRTAPSSRRRPRSRGRNLRASGPDGCPSCRGLWGGSRRDRAHSRQSLTASRPPGRARLSGWHRR
jgi:hypothetical protein